jgi:hypothetical protein
VVNKNSVFLKMFVFFVLSEGLFFNINNANSKDIVESVSQKLDQPYCFFKTTGKDPYVIVHYPGKGELHNITCGTYNSDTGETTVVKDSPDLKNLEVIRSTKYFADSNIKLDVKHPGYRKTNVGKVVESFLDIIDLVPMRSYKGEILLDEYNAGFPMKWVLGKGEDLKEICKYLTKKFEQEGFLPQENKPILVVEIGNHNEKIENTEELFLNKYFTVVDIFDPTVKKMFDAYQKNFYAIKESTKGAETVGETLVEKFFAGGESFCKDFDTNKVAYFLTTAVVSGFVTKAVGAMWSGYNKKAEDTGKGIEENLINKIVSPSIAIGCLGGSLWILYKFMRAIKKERNQYSCDCDDN